MSTPTKSSMRTCAHCGHLVPSAQAICIHCGKDEAGVPIQQVAAPIPAPKVARDTKIAIYVGVIAFLFIVSLFSPWLFLFTIPLGFFIVAIASGDLAAKTPAADTQVSPGVAQIIKKIDYDDNGLAILKGSPKQIEWATRIRSKRLKQMRKFCRLLKLSKDEDRKYNLMNWLESQEDSSFWIDSRNEQVYQFGYGSALSDRFIDDSDIEKIEEFEDYDELDNENYDEVGEDEDEDAE